MPEDLGLPENPSVVVSWTASRGLRSNSFAITGPLPHLNPSFDFIGVLSGDEFAKLVSRNAVFKLITDGFNSNFCLRVIGLQNAR